MRYTFFLLIFLSLSLSTRAQFNWSECGEQQAYILQNDFESLDSVWRYSIDKVEDAKVYLYLNQQLYQGIRSKDIEVYPLASKKRTTSITMATSIAEMANWDAYPTYAVYLDLMEEFALNYPDLCRLDTIGYSNDMRLILALKISDHVAEEEEEPEFLYSATMHGDELAGFPTMLRLIDYLLKNYGTNEQVTNLVDNLQIYINPLANPDGTYYGSNTDVSDAIRYNSNFKDLNRNFPDPRLGDHPDGNDWQPENIAMMNWMDTHHFVLSMNFHSGSEVLNYPWDTWTARHSDTPWFIAASRAYADTVHQYSSNYLTDLENGITNGSDWYVIGGGRQDYTTYFLHGREITAEIATTKLLDSADLPDIWNYNYRSLLNYMQEALYGIHGYVHHADGTPIAATIEIAQHDSANAEVIAQSNGLFYRYIAPGEYTLNVQADGYIATQIKNITVSALQQTQVDITLYKTDIAESQNEQMLLVYPNPTSGEFTIQCAESKGALHIYNTQGQQVYASPIHETSTKVRLSPGLYFVKAVFKNQTHVQKVQVQ